jgi:protein ImuB
MAVSAPLLSITANPRRYLALWFPYLPCETIQRVASTDPVPGDPAPPDAAVPFALVARSGNALKLVAVDPLAVREGLSAGMNLADARARVPTLATLPDDPAAVAQRLDALVAAMRRFSPMVAADPPDGVMIDITGCAHLFAGEAAMARAALALVGEGAGKGGHRCRHALADHAPAARALVRFGGDDVRALPVEALELDERALAALRRAGLRTIGALADRPSPALAARFGEAAVMRLRQMLGEVASPMVPVPPPAPIRLAARFAEPLLHSEDALDVIESLLVDGARELEQRQQGGRRFIAELCRSDNQRRRLMVETGQPVRDPAVVMRLMRERIDSLSDPLDPGFGYDSIALFITRTEPLASRQIALVGVGDDGRAAGEGLAALIDRLSVRFGADHVRRLAPCDRHLPECAQTLLPASDTQTTPWLPSGERPLRPLLLFDPPQPVTALAEVPDGPPRRFRWQGRLHDVIRAEGPERIAAEWWRQSQGHHPGGSRPTRDYYRVEDGDGRRFWLFRYGLFGECADPGWYLHGLFA